MKKINLPISAKDGQLMTLSNRHIGTTDFFRPFVNYSLEVCAKDKIRAAIRQYVQGYPLAGANLGQFTHSLHSFFVPYRTLMSDWNNFITNLDCRFYAVDTNDNVGANVNRLLVGRRTSVPVITRTDFMYMFFPEKIAFEPSNYDQHQSSTNPWLGFPVNSGTTQNDIADYISKLQNSSSLENNPFVEFYAITKASFAHYSGYAAQYSGRKFDVIGSLLVNGQTHQNYTIGIAFTPYGRLMYQLIRSLGYKFDFGGFFQESTELSSRDLGDGYSTVIADFALESSDISHVESFSALPFLSLYKVFVDWYVPSKFKNNYDLMMQQMSMLQYPFREIHEPDSFDLTKPYPIMSEILLYTCYGNDYFTNAFLYPNGSNSEDDTNILIKDPTGAVNDIHTLVNGTPVIGTGTSVDDIVTQLSSYSLRALRALNNYVRRNQIVGYRAIDRFLARFGVKLDYVQTNRSVQIASNSSDFFPEVVMSNADTHSDSSPTPESQQALLGGRSANLTFGTDLKFDFDSKEQGHLLVLSSVYPKVGYVQGLDRTVLHKEVTDFYQPEFDSLGVQPILVDELYSGHYHGVGLNRSGSIFGYTCRYAEYKYKQDDLSGDFILPSRNAFLESLHTFRIFDGGSSTPASINNAFLIGNGAEYDRVFQMDTDEYDHLQTASYNDVNVIRHADSASDVKDITDGSGQYMHTSVGGNHSIR